MPNKMFSVFLLSFASLLLVLLYIRSQSSPLPPPPSPGPPPSPSPNPSPPSPSPATPSVGGCKGTRYGCCLDGKVACVDNSCSNCKGNGSDLKKK